MVTGANREIYIIKHVYSHRNQIDSIHVKMCVCKWNINKYIFMKKTGL